MNSAATRPQLVDERLISQTPGDGFTEEIGQSVSLIIVEAQALGVHPLVVAVEHHRVLGVRDAEECRPKP